MPVESVFDRLETLLPSVRKPIQYVGAALNLAGIPLDAADRTDDDPVVVAGGHAAFNPEPIASFVDAAVVGDGEQAVLAITDIVREHKVAGRPGGREELLLRLARTGTVY